MLDSDGEVERSSFSQKRCYLGHRDVEIFFSNEVSVN